MPPKAKTSTKQAQKEKQRIVEDKTFGMKNKNKSKKVQKFIDSVEKGANHKTGLDKRQKEAELSKKKKDQDEIEKGIEQLLNGGVVVPVQKKLDHGVDPKSVLCQFFKAGSCKKGDKCKYSHDPNVERKVQKIDMYTDMRDGPEAEEDESMENWDQAKLESVVNKKNGSRPNQTDKVCKYFIEAIESKKYGWFWECSNGPSCMYRHALPPGFVLKSQQPKGDEMEEETPIEELIEEERAKLQTHTPITLENFLLWKQKKRAEKDLLDQEQNKKRKADISAGRVQRSGRELFELNPEMFADDDDAVAADEYTTQEIEEGFHISATATSLTLEKISGYQSKDLLDEYDDSGSSSSPAPAAVAGVDVDASLFADEEIPDDEDL